MFPRAAEFLKPTHFVSKLCGVFPTESLTNDTVSFFYQSYCIMLLALSTFQLYHVIVNEYSIFKDIVCLTIVLHSIFNFLCHLFAIIIAILFRKKYLNLFDKLNNAEVIVNSLNIRQEECPSKFRQRICIIISFLIVISNTGLV